MDPDAPRRPPHDRRAERFRRSLVRLVGQPVADRWTRILQRLGRLADPRPEEKRPRKR